MTNPDDRTADRLLSGYAVDGHDDLVAALDALRAEVPAAAPAPSAALAAMLEGGIPLEPAPRASRAVSWRAVSWRYALVGSAAALAAVVGAGAANALPDPAQRTVADVVAWLTPLDLPRPAAPPEQPTPAPTPTPTPTVVVVPAPVVTRSPVAEHRDGTEQRTTTSDGTTTRTSGETGDTPDSPTPRPSASPTSGSDSGDSGSGSGDGGSASPSPSESPSSNDGSSSLDQPSNDG